MGGDQERLERPEGVGGFERGGHVDLNAIAGRKHHRFVGRTGVAQPLERGRDGGFGKGEALPDGDG